MQSTEIFDRQLARLKSALGVSEDQEAAAALELSKAALSARKKRGSFPEKELRALAQQRPELEIDVAYVLTGKTQWAQAVEGAAAVGAGALERLEAVAPTSPSSGPSTGAPKSDWREILVMLLDVAPPDRWGWSGDKFVRAVDFLYDLDQRGVKMTAEVATTILKRMP